MSTEDQKVPPVTPGEILEYILKDNQITLTEFATLSEIPLDDLKAIIANKKPIAHDTAQAIGKALATSPQIWLDLQVKTDNWNKRGWRAIVARFKVTVFPIVLNIHIQP